MFCPPTPAPEENCFCDKGPSAFLFLPPVFFLLATTVSTISITRVLVIEVLGFPGGPDGKESACHAGDRVQSLGWEDALEEGMATDSSILAWRIPMDRGARQVPGVAEFGHNCAVKHRTGPGYLYFFFFFFF